MVERRASRRSPALFNAFSGLDRSHATYLQVLPDGEPLHLFEQHSALSVQEAPGGRRGASQASPPLSPPPPPKETVAVEGQKVDFSVVVETDLPESMRPMSPEDRQIYVEEMQWKREDLRRQIAELSAKRRVYVAEQSEAEGLDDSRAFDTVVRRALREKLDEKGFQSSER